MYTTHVLYLHCLQSLFHIPVFREVILEYQPPSLPNGMSEVPPPLPPSPHTHTYTLHTNTTTPHLLHVLCTPHMDPHTTHHIPHPSHPSPLTSLTPHPSDPSLTVDICILFTLNPSPLHPSPSHTLTLTVSPVCTFCSGTSEVVCPSPPK